MTQPVQVPRAPLLVLDTNCFIDATNPLSHAYVAVQELLRAAAERVRICVSLHSLHELENGVEKYGANALGIAKNVPSDCLLSDRDIRATRVVGIH